MRKAADFMVRYRDRRPTCPRPRTTCGKSAAASWPSPAPPSTPACAPPPEFARSFGEADNARRYDDAASEIRAGMDAYLWRPELNRFARMINITPPAR